jgi:hypothetical protein
MKKTSKPNALKLFNDNKANAIKKANATMSTFKKSLPKAQNGIEAGPQTKIQSVLSNAMNSQPPIPRPNRPSRAEIMGQMMSPRSEIDLINKARTKNNMDTMTNKSTSNTPMIDGMIKQKIGGSVKKKK